MFSLFNSSASAAFQNLQPAEFAQGLRQPGAVLLDVRRPDEFAVGHLPGAINIDVTSPDFAQRVATLDKAQPTYVYCRSGARSATAARQLSQAAQPGRFRARVKPARGRARLAGATGAVMLICFPGYLPDYQSAIVCAISQPILSACLT